MTVLPANFGTDSLINSDFTTAAGAVIGATVIIFAMRKVYNLISKS